MFAIAGHAMNPLRRLAIQFVPGLLALLCISGASAQPGPKEREALVRQFVEAFNQQDTAAMLRLLTPEAQWLSVSGEKISAEGASREAIGQSMDKYFKSCPSCRSRLDGVLATSNRLTAIEVAQWQTSKGKKEQRGISVYEFSGSLISRVYYFPAEP
jgi:uncharacterized protein (TIGR02246 family)